MRLHSPLIALSFIVALSPVAAAQTTNIETPSTLQLAKGNVVSGLGRDIWRIFQARDNTYWFGSGDNGVYRYDGKTITQFTTNDGLCHNRIWAIQEDKSGNIYFTTPASCPSGISKFDGRCFTTLRPTTNRSPTTEWKLQPDDLWFQGAQDAGVVYRYDGQTLYALEFPKTKLGDEHLEKFPRAKFPNAIYSPYDVYGLLRDSKGNLWFGTSSVGVCRFDGKSFIWLTDEALTAAPVRSIMEDRQGNFWFTYSGGGTLGGFRTVKGMEQLNGRTTGTIVDGMSIVEDSNGNIWTVFYRGGVQKHVGKQKTHYPVKDGTTEVTLYSIYTDRHGVLWLGSHNAGAFRFNGQTFERFKP